jgi:hypothetical protein
MRTPVNPYLKRIASLVGEQDTSRALQAFVGARRSAGESLDSLARKLGINKIVEERLPFEGGLFQLPDGQLVIKLNAESPFSRKRFTLAHEIAHLLLKTVPASRGTRRTDLALERTCDLIAAELLMPTPEGLDFVRGLGRPSPEKLRLIASQYNVSLQAAAKRVHDDFRLWKCSIGMWERSPKITTIWFVGSRRWDAAEPDSYSLDLALASKDSVRTNELWRRRGFTDPVWLNLLAIENSRNSCVLGLVDFVN